MFSYLIRRLLYMIPIVLGVLVITFLLFFVVQKPEQMARRHLGPKATQKLVDNWLENRGFNKPLFVNTTAGANPFDSVFFNFMANFLRFNFGKSYATGEDVGQMFRQGALPSLMITVPAFLLGFVLAVAVALFVVYVRDSAIDRWIVVGCVALMSIPVMVYVVFGQWLFANQWKYFPAFGFSTAGFDAVRFLVLPVGTMVIAGLGGDVRMFRAIFSEEIRSDYVRTAVAKGASSTRVLAVHVLKNGLIALITLVVASLPFLVMGSLVIENFFGIPGLGNLTTQAIQTADFSVVMATVYLGALMYLGGLLLTDICYAAADPRIRFT
jgi:peptide/nickel transport system permease protein